MYTEYVKDISTKSRFRMIGLPLIVVFLTYLAPSILQLLFSIPFPAPIEQIGSFPAMLSMVVTVVLATLVMSKLSQMPYRNLGLNKKKTVLDILVGSIGGFLLLALVVGLIWLLGGASFTFNFTGASLLPFLVGLIFFIFQGTWEELMYRAYLMPHLSKAMGDIWSIVISSAIFTLGHALNPGMQLLPVINLFLASLAFSVIYRYTGSLLIVGFGHGLWNFSQGFIFGAQVSGNSIPYSIWISHPVVGRELISGGNFGFEGGLVTSVGAIILVLIFTHIIRKETKNEN